MEFLGRPNLPNGLAQSLVQLAAQQENPITQGLKEIGKLADTYTAQQLQDKADKKKMEMADALAQKQHERAKELKKLDMDASIYEKLLSNDRIVGGLTKHLDVEPGSKGIVGDLLPGGVVTKKQSQKKAIAEDFGKAGDEMSKVNEGIPLTELGINMPGNVLPSKEKITIDAEVAKKYGLPEATVGKTLTVDQLIAMRRSDVAASRVAGRASPQYAQYLKIAKDSLPPESTAEELSAYADDLYAAAQQSQKKPGSVPPAPKKEEPPKKEGFLDGILNSFTPKKKKALPGLE